MKIKTGSRLINNVAASLGRGVRAFLPKRSRRHSAVAATSPSYEIVHNDPLSPKPEALTETARSAMANRPQAGGYNYTLSDHATPAEIPAERETEVPPSPTLTEPQQQTLFTPENFRATLSGFIFSGVLLGLLPMWNSAVFIAAAAILGLLFILCPQRLQMIALGVTAGLIALPQMLYLSTGSGRAHMPKLLHWGYTIDQPNVKNVVKYIRFTFA